MADKLYEIKNRWTGALIFSLSCGSIRLCVEAAVERNTDLSGAYLIRADLRGAILRGAYLSGAYLIGADLREANLSWADLSEANLIGANLSKANLIGANLSRANLIRANLIGANLIGANLREANLIGANLSEADLSGADLREADLSGAYLIQANLRGANLSGADLRGAPIIPDIHQTVYAAASQPDALDMSDWHQPCGTTHCRAGWIVTLAGEAGKALENKIGTAAAATLIYLASDPALGKFPDFYCDNAAALADMKARADAEAVKGAGE